MDWKTVLEYTWSFFIIMGWLVWILAFVFAVFGGKLGLYNPDHTRYSDEDPAPLVFLMFIYGLGMMFTGPVMIPITIFAVRFLRIVSEEEIENRARERTEYEQRVKKPDWWSDETWQNHLDRRF